MQKKLTKLHIREIDNYKKLQIGDIDNCAQEHNETRINY